MSGWKEGESLQRSPINFYFHRRNHRKLRSLKTVTGNKKCVSPWSITHIRPSQAPVTIVLSISSQILQLCTKTRLLKEAIGVNLLVWIVGYKLSQIYNIPWIEFSRDLSLQAAASCLNFGTITKSHLLLSTWTKKRLFILQWFSFFLEEIDVWRICLDMKSTDFVVGKFLDTTNTVRLGLYPNVFLATPSQPSDFPVYIFCEVEIQSEW